MASDWNERLDGVVVAFERVFPARKPGAASMCSCPPCLALLCSPVNVVVAVAVIDGDMAPAYSSRSF